MPWIVVRVGTHIPKVFMAGTFWTKEGKIFYYVRDASKCITLELKDHNHDLAVIEVEARGDVAEQLRKKLN